MVRAPRRGGNNVRLGWRGCWQRSDLANSTFMTQHVDPQIENNQRLKRFQERNERIRFVFSTPAAERIHWRMKEMEIQRSVSGLIKSRRDTMMVCTSRDGSDDGEKWAILILKTLVAKHIASGIAYTTTPNSFLLFLIQ